MKFLYNATKTLISVLPLGLLITKNISSLGCLASKLSNPQTSERNLEYRHSIVLKPSTLEEWKKFSNSLQFTLAKR